jgi:hypothetical protein
MELLVEAVGSWDAPLLSQDRPADLTERVLGCRAWRLDSEGLRSVAAPARWSGSTLVADCPHGGGHADHAASVARCRCGIYALHEPPQSLFGDELVWGAVALDGRVLLYRNGLRAERATILVLAYAGDEPQPGLARAARALDVELVPFFGADRSRRCPRRRACAGPPGPREPTTGRRGRRVGRAARAERTPSACRRGFAARLARRGRSLSSDHLVHLAVLTTHMVGNAER